MRVKKAIQKDTEIQKIFTQKVFKQSTSVCSWMVMELLKKAISELPPDTDRVLTYSGLIMKETTQKIVGVNLLESEYLNNFTVDNNEYEQFQQMNNFFPDNLQNSQFMQQNDIEIPYRSPNKTKNIKDSQVYSPKFTQDEEIVLKKQGVKFVKKQELKNLIKHRSSNTFSSNHCSYNPTYQRIVTKHSLYQDNSQKPQNTSMQSQPRSVHQHPNKTAVTNSNFMIPSLLNVKSAKNFSTVQQINQNKEQSHDLNNNKKIEINRQRISAMMNLGQFVNLDEYYQHKNKQLNKDKKTMFKENCEFLGGNKDKSNEVLLRKNNNVSHPTWPYRESQLKDEDDAMINKLRERKQKFYRSQNSFNGDSFGNKGRQATMMINQSQKNSQKDQVGAIVAFDYNGSVMPTVKYDTLKIAQHYQDMDFAIVQHDESMMKRKRQRKGYMFGGGINLKLVDHQKFLPHPNYEYEPLVEKQGILMKQNIGYLLKKGVQVRAKQENIGNISSLSGANDQQQARERINKGNFQFLHNEQIEPKSVKFQQFLRYKKASQSSNKNISSRKKINDQNSIWEESLLSKKSISIKGLKNKSVLEDGTNKVHKSTNPKALQMLMNSNHNDISRPVAVHFDNSEKTEQINSPSGGLKKSPSFGFNKAITQDIDNNVQKKKVRIA